MKVFTRSNKNTDRLKINSQRDILHSLKQSWIWLQINIIRSIIQHEDQPESYTSTNIYKPRRHLVSHQVVGSLMDKSTRCSKKCCYEKEKWSTATLYEIKSSRDGDLWKNFGHIMMIKTSIFSKLKIFGILVFLSNPNVINSKLKFFKKWLTKILNFLK